MSRRLFHSLNGVCRDANGTVVPRKSVTLPDNIDFIALRNYCREFAIGLDDKPQ